MNDPRRNRRSDAAPQSGFTLVELMVAATVLGLATIGAFSMINAGRTLDVDEVLRRQAYQFATAAMEDPKYGYQNYPLPAGMNSIVQLQIDGGRTVNARLDVAIGAEKRTVLRDALVDGGTIQIPYQPDTVKVRWPWPSPTDSVFLVKWVAEAG